jgi:class 3 adenylate cyclase
MFGGEPGDLRVGDQLIRIGEANLRGVGRLGYFARALEQSDDQLRVTVRFVRAGELGEATMRLTPMPVSWWWVLPFPLATAAIGVLVLIRAPRSRASRPFFLAAFATSLAFLYFQGGPREITYAWMVIVTVCATLVGPLVLRLLMLIPDDGIRFARWEIAWPWVFSLTGLIVTGTYFGLPMLPVPGRILYAVIVILFFAAGVGALGSSYRRAGPLGRRRARWVLYGFYGAALIAIGAQLLGTAVPPLNWVNFIGRLGVILFPLSILIAIVQFNLFDIDRLISATAAYTALAVVFLAAAMLGVPRLAQAASELAGIDPASGQLVFSVALAALLVPGQRYLRPQIDRLLFKDRYLQDQGIAELLPALSDCADARDLIQRAGDGIHRLLRPESCVVYAGSDGSYRPVYAQGRAVPPAFEGTSPLIVALRERRGPLALSDAGRRPDAAPLGPFDRAALETLDAELIAPVRRGRTLLAFLCLGPKRSGDVYTSIDVSHLAVVAEKVSASMARFDQEEIIQQGRVMRESLRRYVPGAVAEQLASGAEPESGEREVTVLFVDLRGYTQLSEGRPPAEIFSTVNRYTEMVSAVVNRHGGVVVEFSGDGMMAVFGAPAPLEHKEQAAVLAGIEMAHTVRIRVGADERPADRSGSVGVGIATGTAFVGNIEAVDRTIWSAIGNTTNLAARLQALTRDLGASIVIDEATRRAAAGAAADFAACQGRMIRGLSEPQTIYALPFDSSESGGIRRLAW